MRTQKSPEYVARGRKAYETRKKNLNRAKGRKAWSETIRPTEKGYMKYLVSSNVCEETELFHHDGLPDIVRITPSGKIHFFEIKPLHGSQKQCLLNPRQRETVKKLLKNEMVESVKIVYYEKKGKRITYPKNQTITLSNMDEFSIKNE